VKLDEAKRRIGKRVFYRSRKKGSGIMVKILRTYSNRRAEVQHLEEGNIFDVPVGDLSDEHPNPMGAVQGALHHLGVEVLGMVVSIGGESKCLWWMERDDEGAPGSWVVGDCDANPENIQTFETITEAADHLADLNEPFEG
jgi:hypothetical protein